MNAKRPPNILMIYPDQLRADAIGCAGNPDVKTPYIDRLAMEGVRFSDAHVSYPVCCPFRASLFTGTYAQRNGMLQNHFALRADQVFLAQLLRDAGYRTGYIGKWHLEGGPKPGFVPPGERRFGFDHFVGFNRGHQYMRSIYYRDDDTPYHSERFEPDYQTDHVIDFIEKSVAADASRPFFGFVCYGPPHFPMSMPEYLRKLYDPARITLPRGLLDEAAQRAVHLERLKHDCAGNEKAQLYSHAGDGHKGLSEPETEAEIRRFIAEYYGLVASVDHNVGRLMNCLDALGITDDTLVVFLSDHGDMLGQHGLFCGIKVQPYRGAMQVPLIARLPGRLSKGRVVDALVDVAVDTMPTVLELCGLPVPDSVQGVSYLPLLDGASAQTRDAVMYQVMKMHDGDVGEFLPIPERGIRTKDWLYVRQPTRRKMLFDLRADPDEMNNLAADADHAGVMDRFDARIAAHMRETGDDWDLALEWPPAGFLSQVEGREYINNVLMPRAIRVP